MKTIGLIGGLTWYSTLDYYRLLNTEVNKRLGGDHSAKLILDSVDFAVIKTLTQKEDWEGIAAIMVEAARVIETAGASCLMIGANTMHNIADRVQAAINIPIIHIADAAAVAIKGKGLNTVALLGTRYTMQMDFYKNKLANKGIETLIPCSEDIQYVNDAIYTEFSKGLFLPATKERYLQIISSLQSQGAQGVVFGCTEIPILVKQED